MRTLGALLAGVGGGVLVAGQAGAGPIWVGPALLVLGVAVFVVTWSQRGDGVASLIQRKPSLAELGTRTERILRLAEEQAARHIEDARREAATIVETARQEAQAIRDAEQGRPST